MAAVAHERRGASKRKKSFLQNAKGMGKKRNFGAGSQMDEETYFYFVRVLELLKNDFESEDEKMALVENVLLQTHGHEIEYSSNQVGCRVIESLVRLAPGDALIPFMHAFSENLRVVATDRFASHVLQALLSSLTRVLLSKPNTRFIKTENNPDENSGRLSQDMCSTWVAEVSRFALNNFEYFVWDDYANHVMRTVVACLSGSPPQGSSSTINESSKGVSNFLNISPQTGKSEKEKDSEVHVPSEFHSILEGFYSKVSSYNQFTEMAYNNLTSGFLQALLSAFAVSQPKLKKEFIKELRKTIVCIPKTEKDCDDSTSQIAPVFTTNASIRLLEAVLQHASEKNLSRIYSKCFKGCLLKLSCDFNTNFSVQSLLSNCSDKEMFGEIFEELKPGIREVINSGFTGVLVALGNACRRLSHRQWDFIQGIMEALDCWEPVERRAFVVPLVAHMCSYQSFEDAKSDPSTTPHTAEGFVKSKLNLHGSLIVQTMLSFNKPILIVKSLLNMNGPAISDLMCDLKGSHIIDSFFKSDFVGEKNRDLFLSKLKGFFPKIAVSKAGSRSLEVVLAVSDRETQIKIMEELASKGDFIRSLPCGKIIASNWSLDTFQNQRSRWISSLTRKEHTEKMFSRIIGNTSTKP